MDKTLRALIRKFRTSNPFIIAKKLGIHIRYADLGEHTRGIYYCKLKRRFIVINSTLNAQWQSFICAHELAHDQLHRGLNRFFLDEYSFSNTNKYERQANQFAVQLLLMGADIGPEETIEQVFLRHGVPTEMVLHFKGEAPF